MRSVSLDGQKAAEIEELTRAQLMTMALSFYDLQHTHIIHEKDPDTKVHRWLMLILGKHQQSAAEANLYIRVN